MNDVNKKKVGWKQKLFHEMIEYWINFVYLSIFFGVFTSYRRLIMAEYQIGYQHYGIVLIKALVLAKVIMIGDVLRLGRNLEDKPLIFPTLYKSAVFSILVAVFNVLEDAIKGLLHGRGLAGGIDELISKGNYELLAGFLVVFFAFVPFFAFKELGRLLGEGKIRDLFFRGKSAPEPDLSGCKKELGI
jgi:hypothetical protein